MQPIRFRKSASNPDKFPSPGSIALEQTTGLAGLADIGGRTRFGRRKRSPGLSRSALEQTPPGESQSEATVREGSGSSECDPLGDGRRNSAEPDGGEGRAGAEYGPTPRDSRRRPSSRRHRPRHPNHCGRGLGPSRRAAADGSRTGDPSQARSGVGFSPRLTT